MSQPDQPQPPHHQQPDEIIHPPPNYHFQPLSLIHHQYHQHQHHTDPSPTHPATSSYPHPNFNLDQPHHHQAQLTYPAFHPQPVYYHPQPGFNSTHAQIQYEAAQFLAHQQQHHPQHFQPIFIPAETYEAMGSPLQVISEPGGAGGATLSRPPTRTSSLGHHSRHTSTSTSSTALTTPSAASTASWDPKQATSRSKPSQKKVKAPVRARQPISRVSSTTSSRPAATPLTAQSKSTGTAFTTHPAPSPSVGDEEDPALHAKNVKYPLLPAPPGTMYSVNNLVILIPENYSPPGTDILPSVFEQYTCRLCRKTYTGKNARSVARRHLQDKHAVSLILQERRSRWDRGDNGFERPKDEEEKQDRNRANKAGWAKRHRQAEKERIQEALEKGKHIIPKRYVKGKKATRNGPRQGIHTTWPAAGGIASNHGSFSSASSSQAGINGLGLYTEQGQDAVEAMMVKGEGMGQENIQALLTQTNFGISGPCPSAATTPPRNEAYAQTERTESPLSSSPDIAQLSAHQTWVQPADWDQMDWSQIPSNTAEPEQVPDDPPPPSSGSKTAVAELAAETLLNLHSSPARSSTYRRPVRPTPLRGFTLGSSSTSAIPSSSTLIESYSGWQEHSQMLDTPISLRPVIKKRTQSQQNIELGQGYTKGKLGERSLSFSAVVGMDDPFLAPAGSRKENETPGLVRGEGVKDEGQDGSPVPSYKKRQPLTILPNQPNTGFSQYAQPTHSHSGIIRSSSALSSTLVPPNPIYQNPSGSPIKRPLSATGVSFDTPITRRLATNGATNASGKHQWPASAVFSPFGKTPAAKGNGWMLSSPANDGIAAELGLVGTYGYMGLETPMRGVVGAETPARR